MIIPEELLKYSYPLKYETTGHKLWGAAMVQKSQFSNSFVNWENLKVQPKLIYKNLDFITFQFYLGQL